MAMAALGAGAGAAADQGVEVVTRPRLASKLVGLLG